MTFVKRIAGAALGAALLLGSGPFSLSAQAGYVVTLKEEGGNVVATGGGPLNLTGLTLSDTIFMEAAYSRRLAKYSLGRRLITQYK